MLDNKEDKPSCVPNERAPCKVIKSVARKQRRSKLVCTAQSGQFFQNPVTKVSRVT